MDWICLLLDANFTVVVMIPEAKRLLINLYKFVKSQVCDYLIYTDCICTQIYHLNYSLFLKARNSHGGFVCVWNYRESYSEIFFFR